MTDTPRRKQFINNSKKKKKAGRLSPLVSVLIKLNMKSHTLNAREA